MTKLIKRKGQRQEKDNYPTPYPLAYWVVNRCLKLGNYRGKQGTRFLEPGSGNEAPFSDAYARITGNWNDIDTCDIRDDSLMGPGNGVDFLDVDAWPFEGQYNIIATNPPFSHGLEFFERCDSLLHPDGILGFVVKLSFIACRKRSVVWNRNPMAYVHVLYPRPSFSGDGRTDIAQEYCACFWYGSRLRKIMSAHGDSTQLVWTNIG